VTLDRRHRRCCANFNIAIIIIIIVIIAAIITLVSCLRLQSMKFNKFPTNFKELQLISEMGSAKEFLWIRSLFGANVMCLWLLLLLLLLQPQAADVVIP
jgi:hypothetical protein